MRGIIAVGLAVLLAAPAEASNWLNIARDTTGGVWYVDADTFFRSATGAKFWVKIDQRADRTVSYSETRALYRLDCQQHRFRWLSMATYNQNGTVQWSREQYDLAQYDSDVIPDSMLDAISKVVCGVTPSAAPGVKL